VDPLALWGAITGTLGVTIGGRREWIASRRKLMIAPGVNFNISRDDPSTLTHAWALVSFYNRGGRDLSVERVGFRWYSEEEEGEVLHLWQRDAAIPIAEPIPAPVDGPTRKVYTPLGPLLAAGVNPVAPIEAYAVTAGNRRWLSPMQPLLHTVPPGTTPEALEAGLKKLAGDAEAPPEAGGLVWLHREEPYLPDEAG
jgi:hypothetical protein